eukprot:7687169-Karenia_brevis.AAC.1
MLPSPTDSAAGDMEPTGLTPLLEKVALGVREPELTEEDLVASAEEVRSAAVKKVRGEAADGKDQQATRLGQEDNPSVK